MFMSSEIDWNFQLLFSQKLTARIGLPKFGYAILFFKAV